MAQIIDQHGNPIPAREIARARFRGRAGGGAQALVGRGGVPFDGADWTSSEMASWRPWLGSPDGEVNPYRDTVVARIRDLVRNDGWAAGTVTRTLDAVIGADFRLSSIPDYRALARRFGAAFDPVWAREFSDAFEQIHRAWATDPARYCDLGRRHSFTQICRLAFRHYLVEGEAVASIPWRPDRVGYGRARWATTVQTIDPDRLSNPNGVMDTETLRGGVELDGDEVPVAYHFRMAHLGDWFAAGKSVQWERLPRETEWGRPIVVHHFDADRAGQHRPVGGIFTPVLARLRMLAKYDQLEVQAAIVNAIFGAYIESPYDPDDIQSALNSDEAMSAYQQERAKFHEDRRLMAGDVRLATLYPGEKINTISSSRPASAFDMFEAAMLRNFAAATGNSYEAVSGDYRGSTYSSARQALLEAWRTLGRRRHEFGAGFCTPIAGALLEEAIDRGEVPLPAGAPDFAEARAEYLRCRWIGPGRGWIDPTKEPEGSRMKMASGLSTLQREAAENDGLDWEENLDQLALEQDAARRRGLNLVFATTGGQQQDPGAAPPERQEREGPRP
ncbi:phage portal protein [Pseudoroseomonas cervicalis]|uniref:Phage portal protein, lambda family n=1 Tax=Pseudoroseomonas cervicalis ATCC 49957 TaxID=525371 RepID=D5RTG5_9PROT|nr:phage portal protein [Pseudoroseomonas cervicalis]EFH09396.1 phage portal protein, lambda family [Pseudoroseomonas cervicalis ATCC 49957]